MLTQHTQHLPSASDHEASAPPDPSTEIHDQATSMEMLAWVLVLALAGVFLLTLVLTLGAMHARVSARIDALGAEVHSLSTYTACPLPPREGDALVMTIRRIDNQLATRCQLLTPPTEPERAGRMLQ